MNVFPYRLHDFLICCTTSDLVHALINLATNLRYISTKGHRSNKPKNSDCLTVTHSRSIAN